MQLEQVFPLDVGWSDGAEYISSEFRRVFSARVVIPPIPLVIARGTSGAILGAAGIRTSGDGFFSETYLDLTVEDAISSAIGHQVDRADIIEVVSLACSASYAALPLIQGITSIGRTLGCRCGVFTATRPLMRLLSRTHTPLFRIAPALANRVPDPERWGSYYTTDPWVCAMPDLEHPLDFLPAGAERRFKEYRPC
ncbi:thermostable hemolysin [Albibacillus kandeliae]|uniref:thermostable hemolysin n=1 Tax=Albibacillus kandeliae TaxID=2174228 RepID=UPI00130071EC|nr:thermostable hemolysin [Albibacillus kandeliae]